MSALRPIKPAISYSWDELPDATGFGETLLKEAVAAGDLVRRYYKSKPVFYWRDVEDFIANLPTERVS